MKKHITLGIMLSLICGKKYTAKELAVKYEASLKTIYRAIDTLLEAGMPICSKQGKNGGYELIKESNINTSIFTMKELSYFLSFLKTNQNNFIFDNSFSIDDRLEYIKDNISSEVFKESNELIVDLSLWGNNKNNFEETELINKAIREKLKVEISYLDIKNKVYKNRIIHPYSLVYKTDTWYLYAFCETRKAFRLFKMTRIKSMKVLDEKYNIQNVDLLTKPWNKDFNNNVKKVEVKFQCLNCFVKDIANLIGSEYEILKSSKENFSIIKAKVFDPFRLIFKIIEIGKEIEIISPKELKDAVVYQCESICNLYKKSAF